MVGLDEYNSSTRRSDIFTQSYMMYARNTVVLE
jgi:hypothetical protein